MGSIHHLSLSLSLSLSHTHTHTHSLWLRERSRHRGLRSLLLFHGDGIATLLLDELEDVVWRPVLG